MRFPADKKGILSLTKTSYRPIHRLGGMESFLGLVLIQIYAQCRWERLLLQMRYMRRAKVRYNKLNKHRNAPMSCEMKN